MPKVNKDHQKIAKLKVEINESDSKEIALNMIIEELRFKIE